MAGPSNDQIARTYHPPRRPKPGPATEFESPPAPSEALLQRHGARVLRPGETVPAANGLPIQPTVYRTGTMLLPVDDFDNGVFKEFLRGTLNDWGLDWNEDDRSRGPAVQTLNLVPLADRPPERPVDAWPAL